MDKNILERLNQINKELKELEEQERNEEKDMNKEQIVDNKIEEFIKMNGEQVEIYNMYKDLVHKGVGMKELFGDLNPKGFVEIVRVIIKGYVRDIWLNDELVATREEMQNIVLMHLALIEIAPEEKELDSFMYALCDTYVNEMIKKGGE
jgi:hypothetical protein